MAWVILCTASWTLNRSWARYDELAHPEDLSVEGASASTLAGVAKMKVLAETRPYRDPSVLNQMLEAYGQTAQTAEAVGTLSSDTLTATEVGVPLLTTQVGLLPGNVAGFAEGLDVSEVRPGRKPGTRVATVRERTLGTPTLLIEQG